MTSVSIWLWLGEASRPEACTVLFWNAIDLRRPSHLRATACYQKQTPTCTVGQNPHLGNTNTRGNSIKRLFCRYQSQSRALRPATELITGNYGIS
ncbi:MAG: hypothetical protein KAG66_23865, partial [Methylococcales bacterium]|nr:hypothetical protein [Methylococcales bacterium]